MIKIILIVVVILLIVVPLYQGNGVQYIIDNISGIINVIRTNTPSWAKGFIIKAFSVVLKLAKAIFNVIIDVIFEETKKGINQHFDDKKENLKQEARIVNFRNALIDNY